MTCLANSFHSRLLLVLPCSWQVLSTVNQFSILIRLHSCYCYHRSRPHCACEYGVKPSRLTEMLWKWSTHQCSLTKPPACLAWWHAVTLYQFYNCLLSLLVGDRRCCGHQNLMRFSRFFQRPARDCCSVIRIFVATRVGVLYAP